MSPDRFCPRCAGALEEFDDHGIRRQRCVECGRVHYRNSKPAVTAIIHRDGKVLLSLRAREPHKGMWDLPGGFLEEGEHPEDGLRREMREETGLDVSVGELVGVWMGTYHGDASLNLVYVVRLPEGAQPQAMDDSLEMRWWPADAPPREMAFAHERQALETWLAGSLRAAPEKTQTPSDV